MILTFQPGVGTNRTVNSLSRNVFAIIFASFVYLSSNVSTWPLSFEHDAQEGP